MKIKFTSLTFVALLISLFAQEKLYAVDGGQLFKSRCNMCHMVDKNSTGPKLQGAKQKWMDAGEGDMIYEWVNNSSALIASGKSARAKEISGFSPTAMPPQAVSKEEIDAILTFVDAPPVVATKTPSDSTATAATTAAPTDYVGNLSIFNWMIFLMVILIIIIIVLAGSIMTFVRSDYFKSKVAEMGNQSKLLLIIITTGSLFMSNQSYALNFMEAGEAEKGMPWLQVENTDLYALLVVNIILLIVVLYLRHLFNQMVAMVRPKKEVVEAPVTETFKKVNAILTDAVPIEEEHTILMEHEYDGIRELDNNLPPWWVWGFFATIVFAFIYIINYHVLGVSDLQEKAYNKEMAKADKEIAAYRAKMAMDVDETNATLMTDPSDLAAGKTTFGVNCVTCHKADGSGDVGPNLTDKNWIYGYDIKDVFATIKLGRPNGMPTHDALLNPIQIQQVASYVLSLKEVANGKPAQGDIIEK
ncbi:MAG: cbb3-type cytochrome c oxidase N-terminal domain-containing protein [Flavobacteriales bacterium]